MSACPSCRPSTDRVPARRCPVGEALHAKWKAALGTHMTLASRNRESNAARVAFGDVRIAWAAYSRHLTEGWVPESEEVAS